MLRTFIVILFSAITLTATGAVERKLTHDVQPAMAVQPAAMGQGADVVKASLVRGPAAAVPANEAVPPTGRAQKSSQRTQEAPREVSLEMVLAALALMMVITMRRYRSGPR